MGKYIPPEKMTVEQILAEIDNAYAQWNHIANNGCQDPHWPDGCNMNLIRNHIKYWYSILATKKASELDALTIQQEDQLSLFSSDEQEATEFTMRPLPPKVPTGYMVLGCKYSDRLKDRNLLGLVWGYKGEYKA